MKTWLLTVLGGIALILAGCRTDPAIALLERDNRLKEDEIWRLRARIEDLEECNERAAAPGPSRAVRSVPVPGPVVEPGMPSLPAEIEGPALGPPVSSPPVESAPRSRRRDSDRTPGGAPGFKPPSVEIPDNPLPPGEVPERLRIRDGASPRPRDAVRMSPNRSYASQVPVPSLTLVDSSRVAQITVNKSLTGGYRGDDSAGDDGITVVVEPRDIRGNLLKAAGDLSVVLLDPLAAAEAMPVAQWDFTATEVADLLGRSPEGAVHLDLAWPNGPPSQERLRLFVRFTTADGRKLQVEREITLTLSRSRTKDWRPSSERSLPDAPNITRDAPRRAVPARHDGETTDTPRTAARSEEPVSRRPAWSPTRRY